jgi:hypothetical protein
MFQVRDSSLKSVDSMGKTWVLDTETKGTGANMVPLEKVLKKADEEPSRGSRGAKGTPRRRPAEAGQAAVRARRTKPAVETTATPLPPGHVRKKTTGEIGKVRSVDPKAGTATVHWLKRGAPSMVSLSAISRR